MVDMGDDRRRFQKLKRIRYRNDKSRLILDIRKERVAAKMNRTSTELPRLEPESSASTNSAMAADFAN